MSDAVTADERNAIERFPFVAEEYCRLIDGRDKHARKQLWQELAVHLARRYEVATLVPEAGTCYGRH